MSDPKISIIIPIYNREKFIQKCVDSICSQNFSDFECLLIDDGSKDSSGLICDKIAQNDNRFKSIHKENGGVSSARNCGINNATGEWVCFIDSDDWIDENVFQTIFETIDDSVDLCVYGIKTISEKKIIEMPVKQGVLTLNDFEMNGSFYSSCNKLYKRKILKVNHLFYNEKCKLSEDTYFFVEYSMYVSHIYGFSQIFYNYYTNINSAMYNISVETIDESVKALTELSEKINKNGKRSEYETLINSLKNTIRKYYLFYSDKIYLNKWYNTFTEVENADKFKLLFLLCKMRLFVIAKIIVSYYRYKSNQLLKKLNPSFFKEKSKK